MENSDIAISFDIHDVGNLESDRCIVEAYRQKTVAGSCQIYSYLGVEE